MSTMESDTWRPVAARMLSLSLMVAVLAGCDAFHSATEAERVAKARDHLATGDFRASTLELKEILRKNPGNPDARRLLAQVNLSMGRGEEAEKELKQAMESGLSRETAIPDLAAALALQGKHEDMLYEIEIPSSLPPEQRARLSAYRGNAWLSKGQTDQARSEYQAALQIDPRCALGQLGLARLAARAGEIDQALRLTAAALEYDPNEAEAWSFQARLYETRKALDKAEASYTQAIEHRFANLSDRAQRALVRIALNKLDGAEQDLGVLKKESPGSYMTNYVEGLLLFSKKDYPGARIPLEKAHNINARNPALAYHLGVIHLRENHLEQAEEHLSKAAAGSPGAGLGNHLLALARYRKGDYEGAERALKRVLAGQPDDLFALNLMGNIRLSLGRSQEASEYLTKVLEVALYSRHALDHFDMETFAVEPSAPESGVVASPERKPVSADVLSILARIRDQRYSEADAAMAAVRKNLPDPALQSNLLGVLSRARGEPDQARAHFTEAFRLSPGDPVAGGNLSQMDLEQGKPDEARKRYRQVLAKHPADPATQLRLAELENLGGQTKSTEYQLIEAIRREPDSLAPRLALARHYRKVGQPQLGRQVLEEIRPRYSEDPDFLASLGELQLESEPVRAVDTAEALERVGGSDPSHLLVMAKAYARLDDKTRLHRVLEQALAKLPDSVPLRALKVKMLVADGKNAEAEALFGQLAAEAPQSLEVAYLQGSMAMRKGHYDKAIAPLEKLFAQAPNSDSAIALAQAYWFANQKPRATRSLKAWIERSPNDSLARYMLARFSLETGNRADARTQLETLAATESTNARILNDLAELVKDQDPKRSIALAQRALDLEPSSVQATDTLAMALAADSRWAEAMPLIEKARRMAPTNPTIGFHLALVQKGANKPADAKKTLMEVLRGNVAFRERPEAEKLFREIKE